METGLSASDIALLNDGNGMGGSAFLWIFALLILAGGGFGGFGNRNAYGTGEFGTFATASSQNEILLGQKFDALGQKVNQIGDGICSSTYALNNAINGVQTTLGGTIVNEGRSLQAQLCAINSNIDNKFASLERSQLEQRIAEQSQQIGQLQMQNALCGVVRYPTATTYSSGTNPFCGCGCNY